MLPSILRLGFLLLLTSSATLALYRRNAITDPARLWADGTVPYTFHSGIDAYRRVHVLAGMKQVMSSTYSGENPCVQFVPRTTEADYIEIQFAGEEETSGAHVGRGGGKQIVTIPRHVTQDTIVLSLMFVLGIYTQIERADRDNFVEIDMSNIQASFLRSFGIEDGTDSFEQPFDYNSVVMYMPYFGAINTSLPTIKTIDEGFTIGQAVSMSNNDVNLVQHIYNCPLDSSHRVDVLGSLVLECHFHLDMCGFTQDDTEHFDWQLMQGSSYTSGTGPFADHSSGSGYYALASAQDHYNHVARLNGPTLPAGVYCVVLWLYAYGDDVGTLQVIQSNSDGAKSLITVEGSTVYDHWYHGSATVDSEESEVNIIIEAQMGRGDLGDFAIDDVYIYKGKCIDWR